MFKLTRILDYRIDYTDDWTRHVIRLSNNFFIFDDEEYEKLILLESENEYDYVHHNNIIKLDKSPRIIEDYGFNDDFIKDYSNHLNSKFFISYLVQSDIDARDNI